MNNISMYMAIFQDTWDTQIDHVGNTQTGRYESRWVGQTARNVQEWQTTAVRVGKERSAERSEKRGQ
jgi:hypothetical protein